MPRSRQKGKERSADLTFDQLGELLWGPAPQSYFQSPLTRRAAYFYHREKVLEHHLYGQRPWAWWQFDSPGKRLEDEHEAVALALLGALEHWEIVEIRVAASLSDYHRDICDRVERALKKGKENKEWHTVD